MDLSKLPKLSQTPPPPEPVKEEVAAATDPRPAGRGVFCQACGAAVPAGQRFCGSCGVDTQVRPPSERRAYLAEAWISIAIGVILLFISPRIFQYLRLRSQSGEFDKLWQFTDKTGAALAYTKSAFFTIDLAVALFAVILVIEGIALVLSRSKLVVLIALISTLAVIAFNVYALTTTYGEIGFQILPTVAVAFGGYMAFFQWATLQTTRETA